MTFSASDSASRPEGAPVCRDVEGRIVKRMPAWEPLERDRRYVQMHRSHVSVFTGLFSWALRANRLGKHAHRRVRLDSGRSVPGLDRGAGKFASYFSLGTGRDLRPRDSGQEEHIHRNRLVFMGVLTAVAVYTLVWLTR